MVMEALKVFCDLASLRNFSKTAELNELSQPTVTRLVHQLEDRLGGQLIDRSKRPLQLTTLGQAYHTGCKRLLEQYVELEASLRNGHSDLAITVRVAAIYSVGLWDMGQYTRRFAEFFPHAKVRIDYLHPNQVYERVRNGTAELGLVSFPRATRELTVLPWREEEMIVACPPSHPLARGKSVRPERFGSQRRSSPGGSSRRSDLAAIFRMRSTRRFSSERSRRAAYTSPPSIQIKPCSSCALKSTGSKAS